MDEIVKRVMNFEVGAANARLSFIGRLCREQRWSRAYAGRAFYEYKRFMLLAVLAGHPVTPSEEVDHVWHLHLLYTRSYWHDLCRDVLGQEVHHGPTQGGEQEKFTDWYQKTLQSYERLFKEEPPVDIWPNCEKRFEHAGKWKSYNSGRYLLLPRWNELYRILRR